MKMSGKSEVHFLSEELESNIEKIKKKTKANKFKTGLINGLSISLGALIALTLGWEFDPEYTKLQKNFALLMSATLTIVNGWGVLFDYKKLWVRQKMTLLSLYQLRNELHFRQTSSNDSYVEELFERYQRIWECDQNSWHSIVQASATNKDIDKRA